MRPDSQRILVINPGSTSTKVALFNGSEKIAEESASHSSEDLNRFEHLLDQLFFREAVIRRFMREHRWRIENLDAVVGRGGMLHPLDGGVYEVGAGMLADLRSGRYGEHASNLGAPLAREIADRADCPAFIVDPIVVDELDDPSRLSGHPELPRKSVFHALNQRSVARLVAEKSGRSYEDSRYIVAHMGGGITVGAHRDGKVIDVNNGLDGDGPFSPERTGSLPSGQMVSLCFRSGRSEEEIRRMIKGSGGVVAYRGTHDIRELIMQLEENPSAVPSDSDPYPASVVFEALCRQIAQSICSHGATLEGRIDAVILTGGMAHSPLVVEKLSSMCAWMAPIEIVPGEREMEALAEGALRVIQGNDSAKEYHS